MNSDEEMLEAVARPIFMADYPHDKWDRFKKGDLVYERYVLLAKAARAELNKGIL